MAKEYKVIKLKNGETRYIFDVNLGYNPDGTRIRTTVRAKSIKEGRNKVAKLMLGQDKVTPNTSQTFAEVFKIYLNFIESSPSRSEVTYYNKKVCFDRMKQFHTYKLNKITHTTILKWRNSLQVSDTSRHKYESEVKIFFNWCVKNGYMSSNPYVGIEIPKATTKEMVIWTEEEFQHFITFVDDQECELLYTLLFYTVLRISEALGLRY